MLSVYMFDLVARSSFTFNSHGIPRWDGEVELEIKRDLPSRSLMIIPPSHLTTRDHMPTQAVDPPK